jgi:hypothetical protein
MVVLLCDFSPVPPMLGQVGNHGLLHQGRELGLRPIDLLTWSWPWVKPRVLLPLSCLHHQSLYHPSGARATLGHSQKGAEWYIGYVDMGQVCIGHMYTGHIHTVYRTPMYNA